MDALMHAVCTHARRVHSVRAVCANTRRVYTHTLYARTHARTHAVCTRARHVLVALKQRPVPQCTATALDGCTHARTHAVCTQAHGSVRAGKMHAVGTHARMPCDRMHGVTLRVHARTPCASTYARRAHGVRACVCLPHGLSQCLTQSVPWSVSLHTACVRAVELERRCT
jgi:hypothetical protein